MKTNIFLMVMSVILITATTSTAQRANFGITAGASINNIKLEGIPEVATDPDNFTGLEAGIYMKFSALGWYVRPMAVASFLRGEVNTTTTNEQTTTSDFSMSTLEVPVIFGVSFFRVLALEAGPTWNYLMNYSDDVNGVPIDLSRNSIGYRAGLRLTISRFGLFGHYGGVIYEQDNSNFNLDRPSRIVFGATFDLCGGD